MNARLDLVYNPASGNFRPQRLYALARELEAAGFAVRQTATTTEGVAIAQDAELVCIHGGDGAVRMVAQALGERIGSVPLCISPAGTINLLARELGYASDPRRFAQSLAMAWRKGREHWLSSPVLWWGQTPVLACLSIGPDSVAVAGVSTQLKARLGRFAYLVAAIKHLWRWPRGGFLVRATLVDGSEIVETAEAALIARGRYYAGPFCLSPRARLGSESVELLLLEQAGRRNTMLFALAVMLGICPQRAGLARIYSVSEVRFTDCNLPVQVDGDALGVGPLTVSMSGLTASFCI